jgi:hypothetical protein
MLAGGSAVVVTGQNARETGLLNAFVKRAEVGEERMKQEAVENVESADEDSYVINYHIRMG